MGSDTQLPTIGSDRNITATAEGTMQAVLQDAYGSVIPPSPEHCALRGRKRVAYTSHPLGLH